MQFLQVNFCGRKNWPKAKMDSLLDSSTIHLDGESPIVWIVKDISNPHEKKFVWKHRVYKKDDPVNNPGWITTEQLLNELSFIEFRMVWIYLKKMIHEIRLMRAVKKKFHMDLQRQK